MFTFAVEEFGKGLLLSKPRKEGKNRIVEGWIFGKGGKTRDSHELKIQEGLKNLPQECMLLVSGVVVEVPSGMVSFEIKDDYKHLSTPRGTTGTFLDTTHGRKLDLGIRLESLFIDWDEKKRSWTAEPPVDIGMLGKSILLFEKVLTGYP